MPWFSVAVPRVDNVSQPDGRGFVSLRPASRFDEVYRDGMRSRHGSVTVFEAAGRSDRPEIGFVAGRRVGNAVRRNRAKRRMRAAAAQAPFRAGRSYVVVASAEVPDQPFDDLVASLRSAADAGRYR